MLAVKELSNDHIIRALRVYVNDLSDRHSPFRKDEVYLRDLAGWVAAGAARIEVLAKDLQQLRTKGSSTKENDNG